MGTYTPIVVFLVVLVRLQYADAIRCLSCIGFVQQPHYCSTIEHCPEGDACVTESYRNRNGKYLYKIGCMSAQRCSLTAHHNRPSDLLHSDINGTDIHDVCTECCHSDLCNAAGCGTNGFPQQRRGPVCLDCPLSRHPADCDAISVCRQGEVCHVEEMFKFGELFYKTSCSQKNDYQCDPPPIYNPAEVGRRSTRREPCFFCCPYDLCNTKCHASTSVVQTTAPSTTHVPKPHNFKGKKFFLMFIENWTYIYSKVKLSAIVTSITPNSQIKVITRDNSTSHLVSGPVEHIDIDANMTMRENGKTSKGIIVTSDTPISVTAFNVHASRSADGYFALPVDSLGVSYIVGTSRHNEGNIYGKYGTSFAVGAPDDNTVVNITLSTSGVSVPGQYHREGDTITVVLDRLDTFYIETHTPDQDLTGTRIVSDKTVAVVSGNVCSSKNNSGCNHLVEYLPPVSKWGSRFMVPPIMNSTSGTIRIISSLTNTNVFVTSNTSNKTYTISTFIDIDTNASQPYAISSDKPVLVLLIYYEIQYGMSLVPSISQFSNEPVLVSPPISTYYGIYDNYIVVSIRSSDQSGLQFLAVTGADLPRVGSVDFPDADGERYSFISVTCNHNQTCSVRHADDNVMFSVLSYEFAHFEAYAYPVNIVL